MRKLPNTIYIVDPYDEDGDLMKSEYICWCEDAAGDVNIKFLSAESVTATLTEALAAIAAIPTSDYSTDGDAAELIRRDNAAGIVRAAMQKLGTGEAK